VPGRHAVHPDRRHSREVSHVYLSEVTHLIS
jgi:hypothetical protein